MNKVEVGSYEFDILVQCINKRPEEYAEKILQLEAKVEEMKLLESRFDHVMSIVDEIYNSGDYSSRTESMLQKILLEC